MPKQCPTLKALLAREIEQFIWLQANYQKPYNIYDPKSKEWDKTVHVIRKVLNYKPAFEEVEEGIENAL